MSQWKAGQRRAVRRAFNRITPRKCPGCFAKTQYTTHPDIGFECDYCGYTIEGTFTFTKWNRKNQNYIWRVKFVPLEDEDFV